MTTSVAIITVIIMTLQLFKSVCYLKTTRSKKAIMVLNNCLNKDNFNVIVAHKKIRL